MRELLDAVAADWRARPTLRYGVYAIGAVLWLYCLLIGFEASRERDASIEREAKVLARMERDAKESAWLQRATDAKARLRDFSVAVPEVDTLGLAQAGLQDWLAGKARDAGVQGATIVVTSGVEGATNGRDGARSGAAGKPEQGLDITWLIRAQLRAEFQPLPFYDLLYTIYTADRRVWVETLTIRNAPTLRVEMLIVAPYRQTKKVAGS